MEALWRAFTSHERVITLVDVGRDQLGCVRVRACEQHRGNTHHVGRQAGCAEGAQERLRGDEHLATHVAALLLGGELVFEVHAGRAGFDHGLHQLERVEWATEAASGVGDDRREPLGALGTCRRGAFDLIGTHAAR